VEALVLVFELGDDGIERPFLLGAEITLLPGRVDHHLHRVDTMVVGFGLEPLRRRLGWRGLLLDLGSARGSSDERHGSDDDTETTEARTTLS
jgi:hypothetical protein